MSADTPAGTVSLYAYRPCVGVMVINGAGKVWMGLRADAPDDAEGPGEWWQMPQGGINEDEEIEAAALRELFEETGIVSVEILGRTADWLLYDLPLELQGKAWGGRYKGQRQMWFAVRFTGNDSEVNIDPPAGENHEKEFDDWQWMPVDQLTQRVVPFKRGVYSQVVKELGRFATVVE